MYNYSSSALVHDVQRLITQLQQNERHNANTLRTIANQLQTLAASETQATAMLQQLYSLTSQLAFESSRMNPMAAYSPMPMQSPSTGYEPARSQSQGATVSASNSSSHSAPGASSQTISAGTNAVSSSPAMVSQQPQSFSQS